MNLEKQEGRNDMRKAIHFTRHWAALLALVLGLGILLSPRAQAQDAPKLEVGIDYNYVRTNAPPGGCTCISMNGGDAWLSYNFTKSFAAVGQFSVQHAWNIGGVGAGLTFTSYLFGPRYSHKVKRIVPFAQMLFGGAHASGALAPGSSGIAGSPNAFAMTAGGGLDIGLTRHFAIRPAEVDYYLTRFANGVNDYQNNFRFAAGVILRF